MLVKEFPENCNIVFSHQGNTFNIQHNSNGYLVQIKEDVNGHGGFFPVIKGRNDRRKNLSTINKYMKEYGIEFTERA